MSSESGSVQKHDAASPHAQPVAEVIKSLDVVNENAPEAKQNEASISDHNGARIKLNEHLSNQGKVVRGVEKPSNPVK